MSLVAAFKLMMRIRSSIAAAGDRRQHSDAAVLKITACMSAGLFEQEREPETLACVCRNLRPL
jgi:hypothetical protein